jgi:DNA-binding CsgD family transcriptional regulator
MARKPPPRRLADDREEEQPVMGPPSLRWIITPNSEHDPTELEKALHERIKELNCLYAIAQLSELDIGSLDDFLKDVVEILPPSWQYPEITCARIVFQDKTFKTRGFKKTKWRQSSQILFYSEPAGEVMVCYREERPAAYEGPFLQEERTLMDAVAERIGATAVRFAAEQELQETNKQLTVERKALKETNTALRTVLARIEEEKREVYRDIRANVEKVLMPILQELSVAVPRSQRKYIEMLGDSLEEITAPFINKISAKYRSLTPTEIQICHMIRNGLRTKEIAQIRGVSPATVSRHRERVRRKLGISNEDVNLVTYLQMHS